MEQWNVSAGPPRALEQAYITVLPFRTEIFKLPLESLPLYAVPVLYEVLNPEHDPSRFFSMTVTDNEISFILDEKSVERFSQVKNVPADTFQSSSNKWRVLQLDYASPGLNAVGIVNSLTLPLAQAGITIFYLSTHETEFMLVPESQVESALSVLKVSFELSPETAAEFGERLAASGSSGGSESAAVQIPRSSPSVARRDPPQPLPRHPLRFFGERLQLCSIRKEDSDTVGTALLRLIFFPRSGRRFFSYSETEYELSLVLDEQDKASLPADFVRTSSDRWRLIRVGDTPLDFFESGIVCSLASPLAAAGVSMFYVSTFSHDFVLVQDSAVDKSKASLETAQFDCHVDTS